MDIAESSITSVEPENCVIHQRPPRRPPIRWWICGLLFASKFINYLDRQSLALLAPNLKTLRHWNNTDYADLVIGFRVAYTIGQFFCGRFLDRVGTRKGATITVAFYSAASILTPLANSFRSFLGFRSLLGLGESGLGPPPRRRSPSGFRLVSGGWRRPSLTAVRHSAARSLPSSSSGSTPIVAGGRHSSCPACWVSSGSLPGRWFYYSPEQHPLISAEELSLLQNEKRASGTLQFGEPITLEMLLRLRETWGTIAARALTDPVWFFITDWFPIYLVTKGFTLSNSLIAVWGPVPPRRRRGILCQRNVVRAG